ncbi:glutamate--tRNA ligase [candidate division TM6 bacterium RIFCSPHIGHO2_12_FULL_38_8]|nr:MAG: glutamate--tRNA ligase [candidate division TM6 bacterium RIFCSPHIGHO2_12_FULL_38_8]
MKSEKNQSVRVRFAPSPTGHLHIGSLRTALFNWLFARHHGGVFLIRIEDTDVIRSNKDYENSLMQSLAWVGINSDEPILHQSQRFEIYQKVAEQLLASGKAYKCFCSEEDLQKKRERTMARQDTYQYDKTCRNLTAAQMPQGKPYVIRFKIEISNSEFILSDLIKGQVSIPADQIDDFVLLRSDGIVTYNFAVVVDDAASKITQIIRGEEHLFNTPKQILLYQALGHKVPEFAHIPLILGPSGQKLSKRDGATSVVEYKTEGFLPQALCNYLVRLGWAFGDQEIFTTDEMIEHFTLAGVHRSGAKFDLEKLKWLNGQYIKKLTAQEIMALFTSDLQKDFAQTTKDWTDEQRKSWIILYQDRVGTLKELYDLIVQAYFLPVTYDWESLHQLIAKDAVIILQLLQQELSTLEFEKIKLSEKIKAFCKTHDYKMAEISQLLRFALIGSVSGPSVFEMMTLLGSEEVKKRILVVLAEM